MDASSELKARGVQSGDKVLEVNNIMVTDATVDKVNTSSCLFHLLIAFTHELMLKQTDVFSIV